MAETEAQRVVAFQHLAERNFQASYRLANAILGSEPDSEDAAHDAVINGVAVSPVHRRTTAPDRAAES